MLRAGRNSVFGTVPMLRAGRDSVFGTVPMLRAGRSGAWQGKEICLSSETSKLALGLSQPPVQQVPVFFLRVNAARPNFDQLRQCSAGLRMTGNKALMSLYAFMTKTGKTSLY